MTLWETELQTARVTFVATLNALLLVTHLAWSVILLDRLPAASTFEILLHLGLVGVAIPTTAIPFTLLTDDSRLRFRLGALLLLVCLTRATIEIWYGAAISLGPDGAVEEAAAAGLAAISILSALTLVFILAPWLLSRPDEPAE